MSQAWLPTGDRPGRKISDVAKLRTLGSTCPLTRGSPRRGISQLSPCGRAGLSGQIFGPSKRKWEYRILSESSYLLNISNKFPFSPPKITKQTDKKVNYFRPMFFVCSESQRVERKMCNLGVRQLKWIHSWFWCSQGTGPGMGHVLHTFSLNKYTGWGKPL